MDIDQTCVTMAQVNMMLYGLNGTSVYPALTASPRQLASLPKPFEQAYTIAQEANASGNTDLVKEIADTLRVQQALIDVDEFAEHDEGATARHGPATATARRSGPTHHVEGRIPLTPVRRTIVTAVSEASLNLTVTLDEAQVLAQALDLLASDPSRTAVRPLTSAERPNTEDNDEPALAALGYAAFDLSSRVHDPITGASTPS